MISGRVTLLRSPLITKVGSKNKKNCSPPPFHRLLISTSRSISRESHPYTSRIFDRSVYPIRISLSIRSILIASATRCIISTSRSNAAVRANTFINALSLSLSLSSASRASIYSLAELSSSAVEQYVRGG